MPIIVARNDLKVIALNTNIIIKRRGINSSALKKNRLDTDIQKAAKKHSFIVFRKWLAMKRYSRLIISNMEVIHMGLKRCAAGIPLTISTNITPGKADCLLNSAYLELKRVMLRAIIMVDIRLKIWPSHGLFFANEKIFHKGIEFSSNEIPIDPSIIGLIPKRIIRRSINAYAPILLLCT